MSYVKLTNLTQVKSNFIICKLPPVTNVPIVGFMNQLEEIHNEYKSFSFWVIIVIAIIVTLDATPSNSYTPSGNV